MLRRMRPPETPGRVVRPIADRVDAVTGPPTAPASRMLGSLQATGLRATGPGATGPGATDLGATDLRATGRPTDHQADDAIAMTTRVPTMSAAARAAPRALAAAGCFRFSSGELLTCCSSIDL